MSPTCSSRFLVGKRPDPLRLGPPHNSSSGNERSPAELPLAAEAYGMRSGPPPEAGPPVQALRSGAAGCYVRAAWGRGAAAVPCWDRRSWPAAAAASARTRTSPRAISRSRSWTPPSPRAESGGALHLRITVRNAGDEPDPNIAVTVDGFDFERERRPSSPTRSRPRFAVNGVPVEIGGMPEAREDVPARLRHGLREHLGMWPAGAGRREGASVGR